MTLHACTLVSFKTSVLNLKITTKILKIHSTLDNKEGIYSGL